MNCQETQAWLNGYLDGELDLVRNLETEKHLKDCLPCSQTYEGLRILQSATRSHALRFQPPTGLERRVRSAVRRESGSTARSLIPRWLIASVSLSVIGIIIFGLTILFKGPATDDLVAQEIVASHVRSLMASHLTDVASSDQHTVKPWFDGKLDFSPPVKDLAQQGFPLFGGRLDYIANRPVAALVYQRQRHFINLFVWPSANASNSKETAEVRQGYNLIRWTSSGMTYWAISDLNLTELQQFAHELQSAVITR